MRIRKRYRVGQSIIQKMSLTIGLGDLLMDEQKEILRFVRNKAEEEGIILTYLKMSYEDGKVFLSLEGKPAEVTKDIYSLAKHKVEIGLDILLRKLERFLKESYGFDFTVKWWYSPSWRDFSEPIFEAEALLLEEEPLKSYEDSPTGDYYELEKESFASISKKADYGEMLQNLDWLCDEKGYKRSPLYSEEIYYIIPSYALEEVEEEAKTDYAELEDFFTMEKVDCRHVSGSEDFQRDIEQACKEYKTNSVIVLKPKSFLRDLRPVERLTHSDLLRKEIENFLQQKGQILQRHLEGVLGVAVKEVTLEHPSEGDAMLVVFKEPVTEDEVPLSVREEVLDVVNEFAGSYSLEASSVIVSGWDWETKTVKSLRIPLRFVGGTYYTVRTKQYPVDRNQ